MLNVCDELSANCFSILSDELENVFFRVYEAHVVLTTHALRKETNLLEKDSLL